jgi:hypothetical protein
LHYRANGSVKMKNHNTTGWGAHPKASPPKLSHTQRRVHSVSAIDEYPKFMLFFEGS